MPASSEAAPASEAHGTAFGGQDVAGGPGDNPFPGPRPFGEVDSAVFFGREQELSDLTALLFAQRAVLLHAPSGAGKSSLVSAGLIPRARQRGFSFLPIARVRSTAHGADDDDGGNRYVRNIVDNWRAAGVAVPSHPATLLDVLRGLPDADEPGRVLVCDQFEELFTLHPDRWRDRADLFTQVQSALDHDRLIHFLFVLRDDYLAWLEVLTPLLRDRLSTRYHLRGLRPGQALDAVVKPFAAAGRIFEPGVAEELVRAIREQPAEVPSNHGYEGESVEPVQLQIVCRTFFERLPPDVTAIGFEDVRRYADVQQALVGFYEQAIAATVKGRSGVRERTVRVWFERQLITPAHTRGIVFQGERTTAGLANHVVDELERRRLIRSEPRGPALWFELTHDRLIDAVLGSNRAWYAKRSRTVTRRAVAAVAAMALVAAGVVLVSVRRRGSGSGPGAAQAKQSSISAPGQTVEYAVHGRAGQLLTAVMSPAEGLAGELRLFDHQGLTVGAPSAAGASQPLLARELPADGDYRLEARGAGGTTGSFALALTVQTVDGRTELTGPDPVPGSITRPDEVDVYTFTGRAGTTAKIEMVGDPEGSLVMVGPGGQGFVEAGGPSGSPVIAAVLPRDGRYEVHASALDRTTGPYRIRLLSPQDAPVEPGAVTGRVSDRDPYDVRTLRSDTGGALAVSYRRDAQIDNVRLLASDGTTLVSDYQGAFGRVIAPGVTYLLVVQGRGPDPGFAYSLDTAVRPPLSLSGGSATGRVARAGDVEVFRQDSRRGDVITVLVTPVGKFDPGVGIVQPDGTDLITRDSGGPGNDELFTVTVRQDGPQLIAVASADRSRTGTGAFRIAVSTSAPAPTP